MSDQRCGTCRFWGLRRDAGDKKDCLLFSDDPTLDGSDPRPSTDVAGFVAFHGADGGTFYTGPDFSCSLWEGSDDE